MSHTISVHNNTTEFVSPVYNFSFTIMHGNCDTYEQIEFGYEKNRYIMKKKRL